MWMHAAYSMESSSCLVELLKSWMFWEHFDIPQTQAASFTASCMLIRQTMHIHCCVSYQLLCVCSWQLPQEVRDQSNAASFYMTICLLMPAYLKPVKLVWQKCSQLLCCVVSDSLAPAVYGPGSATRSVGVWKEGPLLFCQVSNPEYFNTKTNNSFFP